LRACVRSDSGPKALFPYLPTRNPASGGLGTFVRAASARQQLTFEELEHDKYFI
jgi:hypothetical protein